MAEIEITLPSDYRLTDGEIDNIVYLVCKYTVGWPMRQADLAICKYMAGEGTGVEQIRKLVRVTCEYVWDHICGEPGSGDDEDEEKTREIVDENAPTTENFYNYMAPLLMEWFSKTTQEDRSKTS